MSLILENLRSAVLAYDKEQAAHWAKQSLIEGLDPVKTLDTLTQAIRKVGEGYRNGELWLPDLLGAAAALGSAMPIIEEKVISSGKTRKRMGTIVIGTVYGDIHTIGKDMVIALARAAGFEVIDLGIDVISEKFIAAVNEFKPDVLAMSALLTTTAQVQKDVINALEKTGIRHKVKVAVGGGAITQEFADMIGADGYRPTAPMAVELFNEFCNVARGK